MDHMEIAERVGRRSFFGQILSGTAIALGCLPWVTRRSKQKYSLAVDPEDSHVISSVGLFFTLTEDTNSRVFRDAKVVVASGVTVKECVFYDCIIVFKGEGQSAVNCAMFTPKYFSTGPEPNDDSWWFRHEE